MAKAEPAEVLVTATVHDLVVGSGVAFDDPRDTQLKGVPGHWTLYRVAGIDGASTSPALGADEARARLSAAPNSRRRSLGGPRAAVIGLGVAGAFAILALGAVILTLPSGNPSLAGPPTPSGIPTAVLEPDRPPSMVKIDAATNEVALEVVDRFLPIWDFPAVYIVDGVLWQDMRIAMVRRDVVTGEALSILEERVKADYGAFPAFGSIWMESNAGPNRANGVIYRIDPTSGRELAVVTVDEPVVWIAYGRDGLHVLTHDEVLFVDPDANEITDRDPHGLETVPDAIVSVGGHVWICECEEGRITEWDADADAPLRTIEFAQRGFFLEDQRELSQGSVSTDSSVVWLMDGDSGTITPVDTATGQAGQPIGIPRETGWHVFGLEAIWIGAKDKVLRIDLETREETSIPLPEGVFAGGLAIDEATGAVWVSNYVPRGEPIPQPLPPEPSAGP